ncbi:hypothetical protein [Caulobacter sp. SSI4214]|nr:hypothetical protein [Caulobacter sp. SSI4214]
MTASGGARDFDDEEFWHGRFLGVRALIKLRSSATRRAASKLRLGDSG